MAEPVTTEVEGAAELAASLHRVAGQLDSLEKAGATGGQAVRTRAQANAPVRSGALSRSVRADSTGDTITVGAYIRYAAFVEYGTVNTPASPYMRPALEASEREIVGAYADEIDSLMHTVRGA